MSDAVRHQITDAVLSRPPLPATARPDLAPHGLECAVLVLAALVDVALLMSGGYQVINILSPLVLLAVAAVGNWELAKRSPGSLWTALFASRLSMLIFFGLGGLTPLIVSESGVDRMLALYGYSEAEGAKVNVIWMIASTLLICGAKLFPRLGTSVAAAPPQGDKDNALLVGAILYGGALLITVTIHIPANLGESAFLIPGVVQRMLAACAAVGLFLLATVAFRRGGWLVFLVWLLLAVDILLAVILLEKIGAFLSGIFLSLAYLMRGITLRRLLFITAGMAAMTLILNPMIAFGREVQVARYGVVQAGSISERLSSAGDFLRGDRFEAGSASDQSLLRFSFMNVAAYVVSRYDAGQPSETIDSTLVAIVPRAIWPDKPIISNLGSDIWFELTGFEGTSTGVTVPADVYWNLGWTGVVLIFPLLGVFVMLASNVAHGIVERRDLIMMPFVFICFGMGLGWSGLFITDVSTPGVIALLIYWLLKIGRSLLPASRVVASARQAGRWAA